jgi:anaerobic C4-dicarboxylate transporter
MTPELRYYKVATVQWMGDALFAENMPSVDEFVADAVQEAAPA